MVQFRKAIFRAEFSPIIASMFLWFDIPTGFLPGADVPNAAVHRLFFRSTIFKNSARDRSLSFLCKAFNCSSWTILLLTKAI